MTTSHDTILHSASNVVELAEKLAVAAKRMIYSDMENATANSEHLYYARQNFLKYLDEWERDFKANAQRTK
jgi:hypothetical protein